MSAWAEPKGEPSLADRYAASIRDIGGELTDLESEVLAALRAVEAVRAFPTEPEEWPEQNASVYIDAYGDGVEAVQALLEGER